MARLLLFIWIGIVLGGCDFFGHEEPARWLVYEDEPVSTNSTGSAAEYAPRLTLLNLETGKTIRLSSPGTSASYFVVAPNERTLFWLERDLESHLLSMLFADADGGNRKRLSVDHGMRQVPRLSPDGSTAAYVVDRGETTVFYVADRTEDAPRKIHEYEGYGTVLAVSPDNRLILFTQDRPDATEGTASTAHDLFVVTTDGSTLTRLTDDPQPEQYARFSPDGTRVVYTLPRPETAVRGTDIFAVNVDGSGRTRLTDERSHKRSLRFSPDGQQIAYLEQSAGGDRIHLMSRDGSGNVVLAHDGSYFDALSFSTDGSTLIAEASEHYLASNKDATTHSSCASATSASLCFSGDIVKIDVHGGGLTRLTTDGEDDSGPVVSRDGRMIAFWRRQPPTYNGDVFVINEDGTGLRNVTRDSTTFASRPAFITP